MLDIRSTVGLMIGFIGLLYVAAVTFVTTDPIYLIRLNILVPFLIITASLTVISFGISTSMSIVKEAIFTIFLQKTSNHSAFHLCLRSMSRFSYTAALLWIAYASIITLPQVQFALNQLVSSAATALLYALIFSEFFTKLAITKNDFLKQQKSDGC